LQRRGFISQAPDELLLLDQAIEAALASARERMVAMRATPLKRSANPCL
jgi:hypothetical protein